VKSTFFRAAALALALTCVIGDLPNSRAALPPAELPLAESQLPDEVLIRLRTASDLAPVRERHALALVDQFGSRPIFRLRIGDGASVDEKIAALSADPMVLFAEPNLVNTAPEGRKNVVWAIGGSAGGWATQWAATAIDLDDAHAVSTGQGVRVAVLDTGVDAAHPALAGRLQSGYDFVDLGAHPDERGGPSDPGWGHGTHVAGLIALVAPQASIMPLRVLEPSGRGNIWVLGQALLHAVDPDGDPFTDDGAHVINLSLGTTRETLLLDKVVELVTCGDNDDGDNDDDSYSNGYEADGIRCNLRGGAVVVAAAGNGASDTERHYPAAEAVDGLLAVAATNRRGKIAGFSNRGTWIGIAAPGDRIISSVPSESSVPGVSSGPGGRWGVWSGTSMATPIVAGVAALLRAANPSWKAVDVTKRMLDRSSMLCGTTLRQVDASGSLRDYVPPEPTCP
jgi:subtilisin family serine protease